MRVNDDDDTNTNTNYKYKYNYLLGRKSETDRRCAHAGQDTMCTSDPIMMMMMTMMTILLDYWNFDDKCLTRYVCAFVPWKYQHCL